MLKAFRLVYCDFATQNMAETLLYYTGLIGATKVHEAPDGAQYLSLGVDHHNIVLRPAAAGKLLATGFQLGARNNLDELLKDCTALGLTCAIEEGVRPGVARLLQVEVAGHRLEFFSTMETPAPGFAASGIVPGKLGHIALMTPDAEALVRFFQETLGFHFTDAFDGLATFLTCNYDHHVVNIIGAPVTKVHHIAFELRGDGHQYEACDKLAKAQKPIVWGPSRHTAGHNYASYHFDPDRVLIEFYTDMDLYVAEAGHFEPRPWHETLPLRPQIWPPTHFNAWNTNFDFDFRTA